MEWVANRYMFDTNALNRICKDSHDEMMIYLSKDKGFEYFFTDIQSQESGANIVKQSSDIESNLVERNRAEWAVTLLRVISKLQTKYVGEVATGLFNRWGLDGTFTILSDDEDAAASMFTDIINNNDWQYYNDGMIAMVAIVNGCKLVTNDKRLFNKVNKHFPSRAIRYEEFISLVR